MASSEDVLSGLARASGDWGSAIREFRQWFGTHAADRLATEHGVTRRTAERWLAKAEGKSSQASTPKAMAQLRIVQSARNHRAAQKLRAVQTVHAGRVAVAYTDDGRAEGTRTIGDLPATGVMGEALQTAADLIADGDYSGASIVFDTGVLDAYGVPEGVLEITDYETGLSFD